MSCTSSTYRFPLLSSILFCVTACIIGCSSGPVSFNPGPVSKSTSYIKQDYNVTPNASYDTSTITIRGDDIVIDFNGLTLEGRIDGIYPDQFKGIAVRIVDSKNVTLRNLNVHGFKTAIFAQNCDSLIIENCDLSYNYRPRLVYYNKIGWVNVDVWSGDEPGSGIHLTKCRNTIISTTKITQVLHGIRMDHCQGSLVFNNEIRFNMGIGILLWSSFSNQIMHNRLDWNVSERHSDWYKMSAGICLAPGSRGNLVAHNSITHCDYGVLNFSRHLDRLYNDTIYPENVFHENDLSSYAALPMLHDTASNTHILEEQIKAPPLPNGMSTSLEAKFPQGREYILMNEWGPYNFEYPALFFRYKDTSKVDGDYRFSIYGPTGNWKLIEAEGFDKAKPKSGATPDAIIVHPEIDGIRRYFKLSFFGNAFVDQFGDTVMKGTEYPLIYREGNSE